MSFLDLRGTGSDSKDLLGAAQRYFQGVSDVVQGRALAAGLRAYLAVIRKAAQSQAEFDAFRKGKGYKSAVKPLSRGVVRGYLYSSGYGNILESGGDAHYAPIADEIQGSGDVYAGLGRWMQLHAPELFARWGPKARFAKVKSRTGKPWVIPAAQAAESQAIDAFLEAVMNIVTKEVM